MKTEKNIKTEVPQKKTPEVKALPEKKDDTPRVYCGPSVRGIARQYTVFQGEIPELLAGFVKEHPIAEALIVSTKDFAETRRKLETAGTAEAILYKQIKSEL